MYARVSMLMKNWIGTANSTAQADDEQRIEPVIFKALLLLLLALHQTVLLQSPPHRC